MHLFAKDKNKNIIFDCIVVSVFNGHHSINLISQRLCGSSVWLLIVFFSDKDRMGSI